MVETADLAGDLGVEVAHEGGELLGGFGDEEQVTVVGEVDEGADLHGVALLGTGEGADEDGVELGGGTQEEAALDDAAGDLYEMGLAGGEVAEGAGHALVDGNGG
jgi:hypothetical protein